MGEVRLTIDGCEIAMVPFVQNLVRNVTLAVVRELEGYAEGSHIEIEIR
jgi:molybdopterin-guanine dinucleotide biosynthesis protein B